MANQHFYPETEPYDTGSLMVDKPHELYYEQCGNPDGDPILFLHGGPGAGCTEIDRRFFDPQHFRIVLFDQRGSGRSTPAGDIRNAAEVWAHRATAIGGETRDSIFTVC